MKLLFLSSVYYPDILGGGEYSTKIIAETLVENGVRVDVLCCGNGEFDEINGVRVFRKQGYAFDIYQALIEGKPLKINLVTRVLLKYSDYFFVKRVYKYYYDLFKKGDYDIIQTNSPVANMGRFNIWKAASDLGIPISHVFRCPALVADHGIPLLDVYLRGRNAKALKLVDYFVGPSRFILEYNSVLYRRIASGEVIPNSVKEKPVKQIKKKNTYIYAGEFSVDKGIETLLKALDVLDYDYDMIFVGKGSLKKEIASKGYRVIDWVGKEELFKLIGQSTLLILPSQWPEAFGRVIIESVANYTIPIASRIAGIPEVLQAFPELMFEPYDYLSLAEKISYYSGLSDKEYYSIISLMQKDFMRYSEEACKRNWLYYFDRIIRELK